MSNLLKGILTLALFSGLTYAADITGLDVIQNTYDRPTGDNMQGDLSMILINSRGDERVREIKQFTKDFGAVDKKIMFFMSPADVRNTSFMSWSYDDPTKNDDQWIYLPALKKVKRISSDSKGDYFMGSDFTYDDLGDRHPLDDTHRIVREEVVNGKSTYVVESIPKDKDYMYSRTITWINRDSWIGLKKEFYDEDGDLLKILMVEDQQVFDGITVITKMRMNNIQKKQSTVMSFSNVVVNKGIADDNFTERIMRRGL